MATHTNPFQEVLPPEPSDMAVSLAPEEWQAIAELIATDREVFLKIVSLAPGMVPLMEGAKRVVLLSAGRKINLHTGYGVFD